MTSPTHSSTRSLLLRLWRQLPAKRKVHLAALTATMLASAVAALASLAAMVPFLSVLADPVTPSSPTAGVEKTLVLAQLLRPDMAGDKRMNTIDG